MASTYQPMYFYSPLPCGLRIKRLRSRRLQLKPSPTSGHIATPPGMQVQNGPDYVVEYLTKEVPKMLVGF